MNVKNPIMHTKKRNYFFSFFSEPLKTNLLNLLKGQLKSLISLMQQYKLLENIDFEYIHNIDDLNKACELFTKSNWQPGELYQRFSYSTANINLLSVFYKLEHSSEFESECSKLFKKESSFSGYNLFKQRLYLFPTTVNELRMHRNIVQHNPSIISEAFYYVLLGNLKILLEYSSNVGGSLNSDINLLKKNVEDFENSMFVKEENDGLLDENASSTSFKENNDSLTDLIKNFENNITNKFDYLIKSIDDKKYNFLNKTSEEKYSTQNDDYENLNDKSTHSNISNDTKTLNFDLSNQNSIITKEQGYILLSIIRDKISFYWKDTILSEELNYDFINENKKLNGHHNICQMKIVESLLEANNKIIDLVEWKKIVNKNNNLYDKNKVLMDIQLNQYWNEINKVLERLEK